MKIALAQIEVQPGQPALNFQKISALYQLLSPAYDVVAFPELALPGYFIGDTWEQPSFLRECEELAHMLAKQSGSCALIFGSVGIDWTKRNEDGRVRKYNAAFVAQNGRFIPHPKLPYAFWIKTLLPNYREFDDTRHFFDLRKYAAECGLALTELTVPLTLTHASRSFSIGLNICEDAWDEDYAFSPIQQLSKQPLDLLLNISCSPYTLGKAQRRDKLLNKISQSTGVPLAYVNCVGTQNLGKTVFGFDGASAVYWSSSTQPQHTERFCEGVIGVDLVQGSCSPFSIRKNDQGFSIQVGSFASQALSEAAELYQALTQTLKAILQQWKISKVVIGASGGIDSALAAALYTQVLDPKSVFLVNMPTQHNSKLTQRAAAELAARLQAPYAVVPIQDAFDATVKQLNGIPFTQGLKAPSLQRLHLENIQARDRSSRVLASIAAALGAVFTCNANKTELTVGFSTLYGDATGFLAAIADLWKGQVYALAKYYNQTVVGREIIPKESISVIPSAELSADQDVNENKGDPFHYPYHDALFRSWVEPWERKTPEDILIAFAEDRLEEVLGSFSKKDVLSLFKNDVHAFVQDMERWWNQYAGMGAFKRVQSPPLIALSRRAYGNDYREHIGAVRSFSRNYCDLRSKLLVTTSKTR